MSILGRNALDINVGDADLCLILGYLASPGRVGYIEAQIPEDKVFLFEREFPNEPYYPIKQGETTGGYLMKQGCQLRIYFNNIDNCPAILRQYLGEGTGNYIKRINKGKFVERAVQYYGFSFGDRQSIAAIRAAVQEKYPEYMDDFEAGYNL
jgi:hypothetical protein